MAKKQKRFELTDMKGANIIRVTPEEAEKFFQKVKKIIEQGKK